MTDLAAFLAARLDEDEMWAREACRRDESPIIEGGVHWQWEDADTDEVIALDPGTMVYVDDDRGSASLRSVEEFETHSVGPLPQFALGNVEEVPVCVGGHIVRWDPARVLAEITAKRAIIGLYRSERAIASQLGAEGEARVWLLEAVIGHLVDIYADHPDFEERYGT